ncbi:MAG: hemolysin III family protein [Myxococcales bacterium]|jgi:hemolysin III|nr:hemolysin III family protein [Myxococcales bacterium]
MDAADRLCLGRMQNPVRGFLHGAAALLSVIGGAVLWGASAPGLGMRAVLLVFAASLVGLYTVSSLYHSYPWRTQWKQRMQRVDHSMIYVLVAGTYTPIVFVILGGWLLAAALAATWGITLVGVAQKVFWPRLPHGISIALQIVQGWLALPFIGEVARTLPPGALWLVVLGGLSYTVGAVAFVTRRPRLWPQVFSYHEVFHVCVVAGSALHYAAILAYVAPAPGS